MSGAKKKQIQSNRLQRILIAAAKQCQRPFIPDSLPAIPLQQLPLHIKPNSLQLIGVCFGERKPLLEYASVWKNKDSVVLTGPEGDFTPEELTWAISQGFEPVS
ncbi:MAG: 16S rRNA (uracil(1498)-N(3))-methyltransferase, partial [Bacteroidia bacterium]|nr:16S rRNA (uracil(1498)-N(3))-methyltransferase [Bacteroidia bacterium]